MKYADSYYQSTLEGIVSRNDVARALRGDVGWDAWRAALRADLTACLGGEPADVSLDIERGQPVSMEGYTRERIVFTSEAGLRTPAYLLLPDGYSAAVPVAVALAGHGCGVKPVVGLDPQGDTLRGEDYLKAFGVSLCRSGFAVIAPELLGFGELRLERDDAEDDPSASSCYALSAMLLSCGRTLAGARVWQARRCLDAMRNLGFTGNAAAMGISGGGLVCAYMAALDDRVSACCVSGFANTYRGSILGMHHCIDNFQPGLMLAAEMPDVLAAVAPRPMLWEAGERDPLFPMETVLEAHAIVGSVYAALGASANFALDRFDGGHCIHGEMAYNFLKKAVSQREA